MQKSTNTPVIGVQLDLGRQKETLEFIEEFIDFIASNGYNTLYLHLESGVRVPAFSFAREDKSYSPDEIRRIVKYAREKEITVVPIIATLGHGEHFLAHPELRNLSEQREKKDRLREFCPSLTETYEFLFRFVAEVSALFDSDVIHIGCDEVFELATCSLCRKRLENGETRGDIFLKHVEKMRAFIVGTLKKRVMIWDDMADFVPEILPRLSRDIEMVFWEYNTISECKLTKFGNRKKIDIFREYETLGFRCHAAPRALNLENISTISTYASKYHNVGLLLTEWEHSCDFMYALYPQIAFAGRLWKNGIRGDENEILPEVCRSIFGIDDPIFVSAVKLYLYLNRSHPMQGGYRKKPDECTREQMASMNLIRNILTSRAGEVRSELGKRVLEDICVSMDSLFFQLRAALEVSSLFRGEIASLPENIDDVLREVKNRRLAQWELIRPGLPHQEGFDGLFEKMFSYLKNARSDASEMTALLEVGFFLPDIWGRQDVELFVRENESTEFVSVFKETPKPEGVGEVPYYSFYIPLRQSGISALRIRSNGLNGVGVTFCKIHYKDGVTIGPAAIESVSGLVSNPENLLTDDTSWTMFGNRDGLGHIFDSAIASVPHEIVLKMKNK